MASAYRGKGIAAALINRVCLDVKLLVLMLLEVMYRLKKTKDDFDFTGPVALYKKSAFKEIMQENVVILMGLAFNEKTISRQN